MAILAMAAEWEDIVPNSLANSSFFVTASNAGSWYRSGYGRACFYFDGANPTWNFYVPFAAQTTFGVTARLQAQTNSSNQTTNPFLILSSGSSGRIRLRRTSTTNPTTLTLEKHDGSSATSLGVSTLTVTGATLYKIDILVDSYGASGQVRVYVNNTLYIDTGTGVNIAAGGSTSLDRAYFYSCHSLASSLATTWSEIIVASDDTRPMSLVTLAPSASGDTTAWTSGAYTDIDELTAADSDVAVSDTAAQVLTVNCSNLPSGISGQSIRALKSVAYAQRGSTGPSKLDLGLRSSSTNAFAASQTLDIGLGAFSATWATNPITGSAFTTAEIDAIQLAYRSAT